MGLFGAGILLNAFYALRRDIKFPRIGISNIEIIADDPARFERHQPLILPDAVIFVNDVIADFQIPERCQDVIFGFLFAFLRLFYPKQIAFGHNRRMQAGNARALPQISDINRQRVARRVAFDINIEGALRHARGHRQRAQQRPDALGRTLTLRDDRDFAVYRHPFAQTFGKKFHEIVAAARGRLLAPGNEIAVVDRIKIKYFGIIAI